MTNLENNDPPDWYDKSVSETFSMVNTKSSIQINSGYDLIKSNVFKHPKCPKINNVNRYINTDSLIALSKLGNSLLKINNIPSLDIDSARKNLIKQKTIMTKMVKNMDKMSKVTKCTQYHIYPNTEQISIINSWFKGCDELYTFCIKKYEETPDFFNESYTKIKQELFHDFYGDKCKNVPYDILTDELRIFCSNLKSCKTNMDRNNIKTFKMKPKNTSNGRCIFLPRTSIKKNSIYKTHLGKMLGMENINIREVKNDCRLIYNKRHNRYILLVPVNVESVKIKDREKVVALDPGEKVFITYFGSDGYGQIGRDTRERYLAEQIKIRKWQRIRNRKKNRRGKMKKASIRKIGNKIKKCYERLRNFTKEMHNKAAIFLCKRYERIMIPEFKTKGMIRNRYKQRKEEVKKRFEEDYDKGKEELKKYKKQEELNKRVKFVLSMQSHYKFKQHLINKGNEYGCEVIEVTEEDTSKTCTKCGWRSKTYNNREKTCERCKYKINRDVNGARNILIKNIKRFLV